MAGLRSPGRLLAGGAALVGVTVLGLALAWPPAAPGGDKATVHTVETEHHGCTFRLTNGFSATRRTQQAQTRQVGTPTCPLGARGEIQVQACLEPGGEFDLPDCTPWHRPTPLQPYASAERPTSVPLESVHYLRVAGDTVAVPVAPPDPPTAPR
jgi:hypothetical protein